MRLRLFFPLVILLLMLATAAHAACWDDALGAVKGELLVMRSGAVYRILNGPNAIAFWLPPARVTICEQIADTGPQPVPYFELRNQDANQMIRALRER
jgi:hypothetical protein